MIKRTIERGYMASETRTFGNVLRSLLEANGAKRVADMARTLEMAFTSAKYALDADANPTISRALDYLDKVGYTLAVVPKGSELPEGSTFLLKTKEKSRSKKGE